jgi:NAD(P)-dependent dehydrogenase (short-subunit alcohol dehydrogenase family)
VGKLKDRIALITGGDSGIGRATAVAMAREGAKIAIVYLDEHRDADETLHLIERESSRGIKLAGDVGNDKFCTEAVERTVQAFGRLDILINNAAEQHEIADPLKIEAKEVERRFRTNIFGYFFMEGRAAASQARRRDPQYDLSHGLQRPRDVAELCGNQGRDRELHPVAFGGAGREGHPRQRSRAGPDLDAAHHSGLFRSQARRQARRRDPDETRGAAPTRSRRATCSWRARMPPTSAARCCTPTGAP